MSNRGFSLIELMVALVVASVAVTVAASLFMSTTDALSAMGRRAGVDELEAAGLLWLQEGLLAAWVSTAPSDRFRGDSSGMSFRAMLPGPQGWSERVPVNAVVEGGYVVVRTGGEVHKLPDSVTFAAFDYLLEPGAESSWLDRYESLTATPLAVRLRRRRADGPADTVLFYVGRGL
jgi:prepilin-type N-terminal cleavage/methylation domain-containing protein